MHITVKATVNPGVSSLHRKLILNRADTAKALEAADTTYRQLMAANFATQGTSGGLRWPDNTTFTRALKQHRGQPDRVLVATGGMERGLTQKGGDHVAKISTTDALTTLILGAEGRTAMQVEVNANYATPRNAVQMTQDGEQQIGDAVHQVVRNVIKSSLTLEVV